MSRHDTDRVRRFLSEHPAPYTVGVICRRLKASPTCVRSQIAKLYKQGLLNRIRSGNAYLWEWKR